MSDFFGEGLSQLQSEFGFDPKTGDTEIKRWRGTPSQVASQFVVTKLLGLRSGVSEEDEGGYHILSVWYGATETQPPDVPLSDIWSLEGNQLEKSLWELDKVQDQFDGWSTADIVALKADVEQVLAGSGAVADILGGLPPGTDATVIEGLIKALARGIESKSISQFVLKRVLTVVSTTSIKPAYDGVNKVITTANLEAGVDPGAPSIPSTLLFVLPDGYWLKQAPTVTRKTSTTWELTQEWWHADKYDTFVYEAFP